MQNSRTKTKGEESMSILLLILPALWIIAVVGWIFPKFGHIVFGWHHVSKIKGNNGASNYGKCDYCRKKCLQDSQGNWF